MSKDRTLGKRWVIDATLDDKGGAQAIAYLVHNVSGDLTPCVAKVLRPYIESKAPTPEEQVGRFRTEVRTLQALNAAGCPNIVTVIDADVEGSDPEQMFYVMP